MKNIFRTEISDFERVSEILKVLAHPIRLQMVHQLLKKQSLNVTGLQQYFDMPQSTISQHLGKLKLYKVVACERKGLEVFYRVDDEKVKQTLQVLIGLNR
ncbi:helix-turn-helix transcriptional regulator [Bacillus cereus group sp. N6]|uniref:ArsR/SmtB family transcription factor n=1 Tax=Bacillus cereus group sp. N6 TaxID=2794583 RepID=UPI0018F34B0D|nr:metalloregulator ArsR/SmtB family transcription factor [Bacillus cereus group sp. N6]MBJ8113742.1 helix-turn-helix transcriptional regulator [Bacillus cereus group sp. N6]